MKEYLHQDSDFSFNINLLGSAEGKNYKSTVWIESQRYTLG